MFLSKKEKTVEFRLSPDLQDTEPWRNKPYSSVSCGIYDALTFLQILLV
jgi:hypothetical protein